MLLKVLTREIRNSEIPQRISRAESCQFEWRDEGSTITRAEKLGL
jgi:hypothetical protein